MKVLHLWKGTTDQAGGGGMLMGQLHRELKALGVESRIMADYRAPEEGAEDVALTPRWKLDSLLRRVTPRMGLNDIHVVSSFGLPRHPWFQEADVVHLHGTHSGFLNYLALPALARSKPLVMTLHDVWATTGHCAVSFDCERWRSGCGNCPYPEAHPQVARDATATEWKLKRWAFQRAGLSVVTVSQPLLERAQQSLLAGLPMRMIANGVDAGVFRPADKQAARQRLGLPADKIILLFCARQLMDHGKGWDMLAAAIDKLPGHIRERVEVAMMGNDGARLAENLPVPSHNLGFRTDDAEKATIYTAADIQVVPSRAEALSLVMLEAMACARPQVGFNVGGIPQLIDHKANGYLSRYEDADDFARGLLWLLEEPGRLEAAGRHARAMVERDYSRRSMTTRYMSLYRELLNAVPAGEAAGEASGAIENDKGKLAAPSNG